MVGIKDVVFNYYILYIHFNHLYVKDHDQDQWRIIFIIVAGLNIIGAVVFCLLGSGQVQPWAEPSIEMVIEDTETNVNTQSPDSDKNNKDTTPSQCDATISTISDKHISKHTKLDCQNSFDNIPQEYKTKLTYMISGGKTQSKNSKDNTSKLTENTKNDFENKTYHNKKYHCSSTSCKKNSKRSSADSIKTSMN